MFAKTKKRLRNMPTINSTKIVRFHHSDFLLNAPTNVSNDLDSVPPSLTAPTDVFTSVDFVSFPPVSAVHSAGDVVSLEAMLFKGKLEYDFDVTLGKAVAGNLTGRESTLQGHLSDYSKLFDQLLSDPGNCGLKIQFYVMRLKSDTLLVERLFRDFIKRCRLHLRVLSKEDRSMSCAKQSHLLLREIDRFSAKKGRVFKHIDEAIEHYRSQSDGLFHSLEKEVFSLR